MNRWLLKGLFRFPIPDYVKIDVSFRELCLLVIQLFHLFFWFTGINFCNFSSVYRPKVTSLISDVGHLEFLCFFSWFIFLAQNQLSFILILSLLYVCTISLISAFIIYLFVFCLGLVCCSPSNLLRWILRSLMFTFSCFLTYALGIINFLLSKVATRTFKLIIVNCLLMKVKSVN